MRVVRQPERRDRSHLPRADCGDPRPVRVRRLKTARDTLGGCVACGAMGPSMVRGLDSGADAAVSVLSTALYQALPPADLAEHADQPGEGRKLLLFSDGRQAAAFFAPYLQTSYGTIQHRRLIVQGLERATAHGEVRVPGSRPLRHPGRRGRACL